MDDNEELEYISSSPLLDTEPQKAKPQDEFDLPALLAIQKMIDGQIAFYDSIRALTVNESALTVKEQLAVNQNTQANLTQVKALVDTIVTNIREKYSG